MKNQISALVLLSFIYPIASKAADWMSLLPSAPMAGGAADVQAKFAGARKASAEANDAQYQMQARQAVADIAAKSIDPATGRPSVKRFYALATQSPYFGKAMEMYSRVIYPQMEKEALHAYAAAGMTPEGGFDSAKYGEALRAQPEFAAAGIAQGRELAKANSAAVACTPSARANQDTFDLESQKTAQLVVGQSIDDQGAFSLQRCMLLARETSYGLSVMKACNEVGAPRK